MELIGHLTGGVAHDFNNILASMFGYAELMEMSPEIESNPQLNAYLQGLLEAGIRARELVAQLLTFSHRRESAAESISVTPIVNEVAKLLRATLPTSISIRTSIASGLPEVLISPIQLHQIVMNLGINARDAIGGAGTIEITVGQAVVENETACHACHLNFSGRYLMLSVRDTGAGIPAENLLKIFDPFFTTKGVRQGSGLGLSVVHGIVHSANGHIQVETTVGVGTELRIHLPVQSSKITGPARKVRPAGEAVRVGGHVLVVDDDEIIVCVVTTMLESLGCKVTGLSSATEALRLFQNDPYGFDMVVTDQTMPDLTGAELARAMLELRPEMPIVLSTGFSDSIDENAALEMGIRHFLAKPVSARMWAAVVAECLAVKTAGE